MVNVMQFLTLPLNDLYVKAKIIHFGTNQFPIMRLVDCQ